MLPREAPADPRSRAFSAALWGAVGTLAFLVVFQAYALLAGPLLPFAQGAIVAFGVGTLAAVGAYAVEVRVAGWATRRARRRAEDGDG